MTQLIFFDIDDTLSRKGTIAAHNVATLRALAKTDIKLVIATGRGRAMLPDDVMQLLSDGTLDAIICCNGQYSFTQSRSQDQDNESLAADQLISHYPLSLAQATTIAKLCADNEVIYKFDGATTIAWAQQNQYYDFIKTRESSDLAERMCVDTDFYKHHPVYQCSLFFHEHDHEKNLNTDFSALDLKLVHWHNMGGDILPLQASKARGIVDVCAHFNIDIAHTMAFGDGMNDMEMFHQVGISIAMGDAKDALKAVADHVTGTIEEHGIQTGLEKFGVLDATQTT